MKFATTSLQQLHDALADALRRDERIDVRIDAGGDHLQFAPGQLPHALAFMDRLIGVNTAQGSFDLWDITVAGDKMHGNAQDGGRAAADGTEAVCGVFVDLATGEGGQFELVGLQPAGGHR